MDRIAYLMRGLPSCGKSYTAKRLAGDTGVVLETDQYFYTEVGDDPERYDYSSELMSVARKWNFARFQKAVEQGVSPIVVDRGNGLNVESQQYARYAVDAGYRIALCEPESPWWQELRVLLKYKNFVADTLFDQWADELAKSSRSTHRVPAERIRRWMKAWRSNLTVEDILNFKS